MKSVTTRYLMTCAAIGAAMGVLLVPANFVSAPLALSAPLAFAPMAGLWVTGPMLALALIRRPGAAVMASFVAGVISSASPVGANSILTCLMVGVAVELAFLVTGYRIWRSWLFYVVAVVSGAAYVATWWWWTDMSSWAPAVVVTFVALMMGSFLVCTWLGLFLAKRLAKAGVARGLSPAPVAASQAPRTA